MAYKHAPSLAARHAIVLNVLRDFGERFRADHRIRGFVLHGGGE
jgi:hypothetical protein